MTRQQKINTGIGALVLFFLTLVSFVCYRLFWEFDNRAIRAYIAEEAAKYTDPAAATTIIHEGVESILDDRHHVNQVKAYAKSEGISNEQAIVAEAILEAKDIHGYLPKAQPIEG